MKKIGIFGGSFDPVHSEHINLAKQAIKKLGLCKLYIIPTNIAPHKDAKAAPAQDRLKMLELAFKNIKKACVSSIEIVAGGTSYTYLTIEQLKKKHPNDKLYLIMGKDMLDSFDGWKNPQNILANAQIAVANRKTMHSSLSLNKSVKQFESAFNSQVKVINFNGKNISSTELKIYAYLNNYKKVKKITPNCVAKYIFDNNLYNDDLITQVKTRTSAKRFAHTIRVCNLAVQVCHLFDVDVKSAYLAAMLHDIAKNLPQNSRQYADIPEPVRHAFLGAHIIEKELGIKDEQIINAVRYHTTAREGMSRLDKLIYVCDMLEPARNYKGTNKLRRLLYKNPQKCFKMCLKSQYESLQKQNKDIYYLTKNAYNFYLKESK